MWGWRPMADPLRLPTADDPVLAGANRLRRLLYELERGGALSTAHAAWDDAYPDRPPPPTYAAMRAVVERWKGVRRP